MVNTKWILLFNMSDTLLWKTRPCSPVSVYIRVKRKRNTSETESDSGGNPYSTISNFWSKCVILKADWEPRPLEDVAHELKSTEALNLDSLIWQSFHSKHHPQVLFAVCSRFILLLHKWLYTLQILVVMKQIPVFSVFASEVWQWMWAWLSSRRTLRWWPWWMHQDTKTSSLIWSQELHRYTMWKSWNMQHLQASNCAPPNAAVEGVH